MSFCVLYFFDDVTPEPPHTLELGNPSFHLSVVVVEKLPVRSEPPATLKFSTDSRPLLNHSTTFKLNLHSPHYLCSVFFKSIILCIFICAVAGSGSNFIRTDIRDFDRDLIRHVIFVSESFIFLIDIS